MDKNEIPFEFVKDTAAGALAWHSYPFTGSVEFVVPKGTRAFLHAKMNSLDHFFSLQRGFYSETWHEGIIEKAKKESPIPDRFNGGLSPLISIKTLLSESIVFFPLEPEDFEGKAVTKEMLRKEYQQAFQCALHEESESFQNLVKKGMVQLYMDEKRGKEILRDFGVITENEE